MSIDGFVQTLVNEKHGQGVVLEDYQREDMKRDLTERLTKFITLNVLTELATRDAKLLSDFQALSKKDADATAIHTFVETNIPDGAAFLAKVLSDFRALYIGVS